MPWAFFPDDERILRESRRRTLVVGAFPDGQSALNLAAARLHIAGPSWSTKRYVNTELLKDQQMRYHHRLSQCQPPLGRTKCAKDFEHYEHIYGLSDERVCKRMAYGVFRTIG